MNRLVTRARYRQSSYRSCAYLSRHTVNRSPARARFLVSDTVPVYTGEPVSRRVAAHRGRDGRKRGNRLTGELYRCREKQTLAPSVLSRSRRGSKNKNKSHGDPLCLVVVAIPLATYPLVFRSLLAAPESARSFFFSSSSSADTNTHTHTHLFSHMCTRAQLGLAR